MNGRAKSRHGTANGVNASGRAKPSNAVRKGDENESVEKAGASVVNVKNERRTLGKIRVRGLGKRTSLCRLPLAVFSLSISPRPPDCYELITV